MKKTCLLILFLLSAIFASGVFIPSAKAQGQAEILPNYSGYFDSTTIPATYHVVGEVNNTSTTSIRLVNITANFLTQDNVVIGSSSSYALLDVLLPSRRAPFEVVWVGASASQIYNFSLSVTSSGYVGERPVALQILQKRVYKDEVGFFKINGTIRNLGTSNATVVKIGASFYDSQGKVMGIAKGFTVPSTIIPDHAESFEIELARKIASFADYSVTTESAEYEAIGTQVTINYGATYTNTTSVTIILTSNDLQTGVSQMRFSNDNGTFTDWEQYAVQKSWTLLPEDGIKTVFAQFLENSTESPLYFDTIILDLTSPSIIIDYPDNSSTMTSSTTVVSWTGSDTTSGIGKYEVRLDDGSWLDVGTNTNQTFYNMTDGLHTIQVKATDRADLSNQESVTFEVDTHPSNTTAVEGAIAVITVVVVLIATAYFVKLRRRPRRRAQLAVNKNH